MFQSPVNMNFRTPTSQTYELMYKDIDPNVKPDDALVLLIPLEAKLNTAFG